MEQRNPDYAWLYIGLVAGVVVGFVSLTTLMIMVLIILGLIAPGGTVI